MPIAYCAGSLARARGIMDSNRQPGFTLIELMVTLLVAAILLGVAIPSFVDLSVRNRVVTATNDFISTVNLARSEAIRRGITITICGTDDGTGCDADAWSSGWIVFVDTDGNGDLDGGEQIIRVHGGLGTNYTLAADDAFATSVSYGADGSADNTGVFAVCHEGEVKGARAIVLTRLRPRVSTDTDGDRIPNIEGGNIADCTDPSGT
jgi:type IV fimbrial biogenesis protein FimT